MRVLEASEGPAAAAAAAPFAGAQLASIVSGPAPPAPAPATLSAAVPASAPALLSAAAPTPVAAGAAGWSSAPFLVAAATAAAAAAASASGSMGLPTPHDPSPCSSCASCWAVPPTPPCKAGRLRTFNPGRLRSSSGSKPEVAGAELKLVETPTSAITLAAGGSGMGEEPCCSVLNVMEGGGSPGPLAAWPSTWGEELWPEVGGSGSGCCWGCCSGSCCRCCCGGCTTGGALEGPVSMSSARHGCGCSCCCCLLPRRSRAGGAGYMHCHGAHARGCCVQRDGSLWHTWYTGYAVLGGAVAARLARRVVVLALVRDAHERLVITVFLDMLAHGAAWVGALVVGAGVGAVLDHLLPILAPPAGARGVGCGAETAVGKQRRGHEEPCPEELAQHERVCLIWDLSGAGRFRKRE
eukprot:1153911-Pelagomonas_calceolata.AAC.3